MSSDVDENEVVDQVLDERRADYGVTVKRVSRNAWEGRQEVIKVYGTRSNRYVGLDGEETSHERDVMIADFPSDNAWEILVGLAEALGYRLEAK